MRKNNNKIVSFYNMIWSNHLFIGLINSLKNSVFRSIKNTSYKFTFLVARDILTAVKWRDFKFFNKENKFRKHPLLYSVTQKDFSSNVVAYRKNESF